MRRWITSLRLSRRAWSKLDVLVNKQPVERTAMIVHRDMSYERGTKLIVELKAHIRVELLKLPIQAAVRWRVNGNVKAAQKMCWRMCGGGMSRKEAGEAKKGKAHEDDQQPVPQAFMAVAAPR